MQKNKLDERAKELGDYFINKLKEIKSDKIREIRGLGLMIGIELKEKADKFVRQLQEEGVLVLLAGPIVLRFLPPLIITKEEIDFVVEKVKKILV